MADSYIEHHQGVSRVYVSIIISQSVLKVSEWFLNWIGLNQHDKQEMKNPNFSVKYCLNTMCRAIVGLSLVTLV